MYSGKHITAIITAAGAGVRFGGDKPKQFLRLGTNTVLETAILAFQNHKYIDEILVTLPSDYLSLESDLKAKFPKLVMVVKGGETRQESVGNALKQVSTEIVLIHDAARPFVTSDVISRVVERAVRTKAVVPVINVRDTVRTEDGTLDRTKLKSVQTPQGFETELLMEAVKRAKADGFTGTDDASLVERLGVKVDMVDGSDENLKITVKADLKEDMEVRIGTGFDVHKLVEERKLFLLGCEIPCEKGLLGHSDADVAAHALMDAILGAASLGDIGQHFPDSDPTYEGISSMKLLEKVKSLLDDKGYKVGNCDITIICEKPKVAPYILKMRRNVAAILDIEPDKVNVKGTTTEKLGFTGRGEGIAAEAVCTLIAK